MLLFCLKSVSWTGNELTGDDVENCENLQQALPRVVIRRTQVAKKKWKLLARFSPTKENRVHQTKTDKGGFSPAVFRSRIEPKTPVTELFVAFVFFFLWRNLC